MADILQLDAGASPASAPVTRPFFSVLISTYNRAESIERCVSSALTQTVEDLEVIVVDDGSTDATPAVLASLADPRMRVIHHDRNRGISQARATAVEHARGEWFVILDSDWELLPTSLARLHALIDERPPGVRILRSRLECDDGTIQPSIMPERVTGYRDRLKWMEAVASRGGSSDAGHCMHRSVFETRNYFPDRRGAMEALWETDLAKSEESLWVEDTLARQHLDAANSHTRDIKARRLIPRLLRDAPDELWMAETMLSEHADALRSDAPTVYRGLLIRAATQAFLVGRRRTGIRYTRAAIRSGGPARRLWVTAAFGLVGRRALACAKLAERRRRALGLADG